MPVGGQRELFCAAVLVHEHGALDDDVSFELAAVVGGEDVSFARNVFVGHVLAAAKKTDADGCALLQVHCPPDVVTFFDQGAAVSSIAQRGTSEILAKALVAAIDANRGVRAQLAVRTAVVASLEQRLAAAEQRVGALEQAVQARDKYK